MPQNISGLALENAIYRDNFKAVLTAIEGGESPNEMLQPYSTKEAAIIWAARSGKLQAVRALAISNADVTCRSHCRVTALHCAAKHSEEMCQELIAHGADVEAKDDDGRTPLHWAADSGNVGTAFALLAAGAKQNLVDRHGNTPLHLAANTKNPNVVEVLAKGRPALAARNKAGYTPLGVAVTALVDIPIADRKCLLLIQAGAEVQKPVAKPALAYDPFGRLWLGKRPVNNDLYFAHAAASRGLCESLAAALGASPRGSVPTLRTSSAKRRCITLQRAIRLKLSGFSLTPAPMCTPWIKAVTTP